MLQKQTELYSIWICRCKINVQNNETLILLSSHGKTFLSYIMKCREYYYNSQPLAHISSLHLVLAKEQPKIVAAPKNDKRLSMRQNLAASPLFMRQKNI